MQLRNRLKLIKKTMQTHHLDALFITQREDIFYYTGWKANDGNILIINHQKPALFVSPLEQDAEKIRHVNLIYLKRKEDILKELKGLKLVGYDEYNLTANKFSLLHKLPIRLKKASELIKKPREIKDSWEIEQIRKAVSVSKKSFEKQKVYGKTEEDIANNLEASFRLQGALTAFDTIVSSGSGIIHHQPRKIIVKKGKPVIIDFGARFNWYCCDVTRTLVSENKEWKKTKENVSDIQKQIIDEITPGIEMSDIRKQYEKLMGKYGYKIQHSFGHGIGLDVHEQITGKLKEGMVITVEPGVYKNNGGCRIEDTILVRKKGVEILTKQIKLD
ncbi:MAG: aminopeptidase P family protein [Candidatus Aenigmarchaeota archaeon]|nr:aminopeptidase P family protein [Candidatus Aenigmarchaeota archaeon]